MSGREANWFRGALAVAGALSVGAAGVVGVEGGAAGAAVVHHRSPGGGVLIAAHKTRSATSHGGKSRKAPRTAPPKARGTKHHGRKTSRNDRRGALPAIGHAKDLSAEPIVHADKHKPPSKLLVKNLVVGTGATATRTSTVKVKYVGADYTNGKDFTATTWQHGQSTSFSLDQVIPGFSQGITGMRVGGRREIVIPPKLGYGNSAQGPIKANETLVFVVDLQGVS
jgi:peptidylprolyl isomerase